ncbi:snRNA-activating protein complex subunit 2 [Polyodon spathula]|uniref:snRNA-activating protein complex subunit 2 n=1 Tax=Polyodon spathula TaxID=7913 RepID=UPI001B7F3C31|nr:snRNA-activating protein complex subunit 2 [Polyodon spathula]
MKPPPRRRGVPERFSGGGVKPSAAPSGWTAWSPVEKKNLLRALKLQERRGVEELNIEEIQRELPGHSKEQIAAFLSFLKSQVRSRVSRTVCLKRLEEKKKAVPIQLWTALSKEVSGTLGDSLSAAFSQVLASQLHKLQSYKVGRVLVRLPGVLQFAPLPPSQTHLSPEQNSSGTKELSLSLESAVILDLILSLPEELPLLEGKELQHQLRQFYSRATASAPATRANQRPAPAPGPNQRPAPAPGASPNEETGTGTNQRGDAAPDQDHISTAATNESEGANTGTNESQDTNTATNGSGDTAADEPTNQESDWSRAGLCPLNPFMVPLKLLVRAGNSDIIVTSQH